MGISSDQARRLALVICNGSFEKIPEFQLAGPAEDARQVTAVLADSETCQFSVRLLLDRGLLEVRREIARICRDAGREDTVLIYYSGNGMLDENGSLSLAVVDVDKEFVDATALDADFIISQLRRSKCRKTVLLIDCCYAGAFFNNNRGVPDGLYAITSCGADQMCADTPQGGAFSLALCAGLSGAAADADGDGRVSIDELHEFVRARLQADNSFLMTPQKWVWNVPEPIYIAKVPRHVFISYAREDAAAADRIAKALEERGLAVWIDREGILSGSWKDRVMHGLKGARAVVMLMSSHSFESGPVKKELAFAAGKGVPIIPVMLRDMPDDALPDWFTLDYGELHRHLLTTARFKAGADKLALAIGKLRKASTTVETAVRPKAR